MQHNSFGGLGCIATLYSFVKTVLSVRSLVRILKLTLRLVRPNPYVFLSGPNEELQLNYAGPLPDSAGNIIYILVAIDRYFKYPSAMIIRSTGG